MTQRRTKERAGKCDPGSRKPAVPTKAIPCRDGCPIQVIPSPLSAKNLSRRSARAVYLSILRMEQPGRFRDATFVRIRQPDRLRLGLDEDFSRLDRERPRVDLSVS